MASHCTAQNEPNRLGQPYLNAMARQARASTFLLTCEEKGEVDGCTGKAPQHVDAEIRYMHRKHSALSNPTCALRAAFI